MGGKAIKAGITPVIPTLVRLRIGNYKLETSLGHRMRPYGEHRNLNLDARKAIRVVCERAVSRERGCG